MLLLLCGVLTACMAQQGEALIRQRISQAARSVRSMQCEFVQTKHLRMLNDDMVSRGLMFYQQGNGLRWEYVAPYAYVFIISGDRVLLGNGRRRDVIDVNTNRLFGEIARIMMGSVVGSSLDDDRNFRSSIAVSGGEWVATLLPQRKEMRQLFQRILLHFSPGQATVTRVELLEKNGDRTVIDLKNVRTNETMDADVFTVR